MIARCCLLAGACALIAGLTFSSHAASAFEGRIRAVGGRSGAPAQLLYTAGTNSLRVEVLDTNFPNAIDVVDFRSGQITLIQPMNRTFLRFKPGAASQAPGFPGMPGGLPPGVGPRSAPGVQGAPPSVPAGMPPVPAGAPGLPVGIGPTNFPGRPAMPLPPAGLPPGIGPQAQTQTTPGVPMMPQGGAMSSMPAMPMIPPGGGLELTATGEKSTILNYECERYEIKQRGESMEIWATSQLVPFQVYLSHQPPSFGPPMIEQQWGGLVTARKLFPLRAVLRADNGVERYRFEVQSIIPGALTKDDQRGFEPPEGYVEIQSRPF